MVLLQLIIISIFINFIVTMSAIVIPDYIYAHVRNPKLQKFLEHDLVKAYWILLTVFIDVILIIGFFGLLEKLHQLIL